jgi:hypothetical protein
MDLTAPALITFSMLAAASMGVLLVHGTGARLWRKGDSFPSFCYLDLSVLTESGDVVLILLV